MGILIVSNEFDNTELKKHAFNFLRKQEKATIKLKQRHQGYNEYEVKGPEIPDRNFNLIVREVIPDTGVLSITIQ